VMGSDDKPLWRRHSVQLAGFLFVAGVLAVLLGRDGGTPTIGDLRNPGARNPMPEIATTDLAGKPWKLHDHRGDVVLVNVWATWCPPCREETPGLVRLSTEYRGKGFQVVGVSMDDGPAPVRRFVDQFHVPYAVVMPDRDSPLTAAVESLPTSFLIDRQGRVATVYMGAVSEGTLRGAVDRLLAER
jgi:thiol-disulfide isomerase/thioredoxin